MTEPTTPKISFRSDGAYMVTGATGALGGELTRWMVAHGARRLILPARTRVPCSLIEELEAGGTIVDSISLDLSDGSQVEAWLRQRQGPPIRGLIHCAGYSHDQLVQDIDRLTFQRVFDAKVAGAWALHRGLQSEPLEHFVLFSSVASVLPNPGMGAYAAANSSLNALAGHRRSLGLPALSIAWGPWEAGMTERKGLKEYLRRIGLHCFSARQGIRMLEQLWYSTHPEPIALTADWSKFPALGLPLLKDIQSEFNVMPVSGTTRNISAEDRLRRLASALIPGRTPLDLEISLVSQGLDSLSATVLVEALYREFGLTVEPDAIEKGLSLRDIAELAMGTASSGSPVCRSNTSPSRRPCEQTSKLADLPSN